MESKRETQTTDRVEKVSEISGIIKMYSLKEILNKFELSHSGLILKMDCEGCEYQLLREDDDSLRLFERIQIEFHNGHKTLLKKLRNVGFHCTVTGPWNGTSYESSISNIRFGYLYAELLSK